MRTFIVLINLALCVSGAPSYGMEFDVEYKDLRPLMPPVLRIQMTGPITSEDPEKLLEILSEYDASDVRDISVSIDSPGGNLSAGILMGRLLNERSEIVSASVSNSKATAAICASACVLVYLGADYRYLSEGSLIGVHQFSSINSELGSAEAMSSAQMVSAMIVSYIQEMRVDTELFKRMSETPAEGIDFISRADLERWNVVTGPIYSETAEYENINGSLGLRLEHVSLYGTSTMFLLCGNKGVVGVTTLQEPDAVMIGTFSIVIDGRDIQLDDWSIIDRSNFQTRLAFALPEHLRPEVANAQTFGARITVPSGDLFYGFEQNITDTKLRDTIRNCSTHQVEPQTNRLAPVSSMSVYDGYDIDGNDLTTTGIKGITFEQCQRGCLDDQNCIAVSYVVSSQWCWPKSGITSTTQRSGLVSAVRD